VREVSFIVTAGVNRRFLALAPPLALVVEADSFRTLVSKAREAARARLRGDCICRMLVGGDGRVLELSALLLAIDRFGRRRRDPALPGRPVN
jgi:hypothetical protein